jgi:DNA-binding winged helix-turn-helix (wHTH) protein/TolB-like protein/Tfp pilus assembly protein PilF
VGTAGHLYDFVPFRLDPAERRLTRDGLPVALTPKCFDLLVVLVENSGHLLAKADLLSRVWPDQFVEETTLSFNISELRRVLGESNDHRFIETVRKKGFRFIAPVENVSHDGVKPVATSSRRIAAIIATIAVIALAVWFMRPRTHVDAPVRTIAVLPFKPLHADRRDEPLEMGICNALIRRLGTLDQLIVTPMSSVTGYTDPMAAGRNLRVDAVVDGYIERSQNTIRVTARLLRTRDGKSLWSGVFNDTFTDIFGVEDSMSRQIAEALNVKLTTQEASTRSIEAYDLYLKGRYFQDKRTPDSIARSIEYLQEATAKDPRYALAFAALSESYTQLAIRADAPPRLAGEKAISAAMRAVELDEASAEAHAALARVKNWYAWDWAGAEKEFNRALELSPNDATLAEQHAAYLVGRGRHAEAIAAIRRAQRLAPVSLTIDVQAARVFYFAGRYDAAMDECRKAVELDPNFGGTYLFIGRVEAQRRHDREAIDALARARSLLHDSAEAVSLLGYTYARSGNATEARKILEDLRTLSRRRYVSPYHLAIIEAGLGNRDDAFRSLERAYDDREGRLTILRFAPEFASLRSDARFDALLHRLNAF